MPGPDHPLEPSEVDGLAAAIARRVETGELPLERIRVAASIGHPGARRHLGAEAPPQLELDEEGMETCAWDQPTSARAAAAAGWLVLPVFEDANADLFEDPRPEQERETWSLAPRRALEAVDAWIACPCRSHAQAAGRAAAACRSTESPRSYWENPAVEAIQQAEEACREAARVAARPSSWEPHLLECFSAASLAADVLQPIGEGSTLLRGAVRQTLLRWALDTESPELRELRPTPSPPKAAKTFSESLLGETQAEAPPLKRALRALEGAALSPAKRMFLDDVRKHLAWGRALTDGQVARVQALALEAAGRTLPSRVPWSGEIFVQVDPADGCLVVDGVRVLRASGKPLKAAGRSLARARFLVELARGDVCQYAGRDLHELNEDLRRSGVDLHLAQAGPTVCPMTLERESVFALRLVFRSEAD